MMRLRKLFLSAIFALTLALRASDKDVAGALMKDGIKVAFDGANAVSVLFADKEMNKKTPTPEQFKLVGQLKKLKSLTVYNNCGATDATFDFVDGLEELDKVAINSLKISDDGFQHFAKLKNLKSLTLWHCFDKDKFNGSGSAYLAGLPKLESYACDGSTFNDEGLKACAKLKQISTLHLHHTMATDAGFVHLKGMANLKALMLSTQFSARIGDVALESIAEIPNLEKLELDETLLTYDGGLKHLKKLTKLKDLMFAATEISNEDMAKLKAELPNAQIAWTRPKPDQVEKLKAEIAKQKK